MNILNKIVNNFFIIITWLIWIINILIFLLIWDFYNYLHTNKSYLWNNFVIEYKNIIKKLNNNIKIVEIKNNQHTIKYVVSIETKVNAKIFLKKGKTRKFTNITIKNVLIISKWILTQWKSISKIELDLLDKNKKTLRKIIYNQNQIKKLLWI